MASLMAFWNLVFVDRKAGEKTGTTSILYTTNASALREPILWERIVGNPWTRISLTPPRLLSSPSGDSKRDGVFSQTLKPDRSTKW